ncbi:MAG: ATP-binding protein [Treponema sp.]|nr:ATP-binding protein [Treponema sp.]
MAVHILLCLLPVLIGALILLWAIIKFYRSLLELKRQIKAKRIFSDIIYAACFFMMIFFLAGYIITAINFGTSAAFSPEQTLIAFIFFFGAIFVISMVTMTKRMYQAISEKAELKKQLQHEELMSVISQNFTTTEDPQKLINDALKKCGEFINVEQAFLARYNRGEEVLECINEWYSGPAQSLISRKVTWHFTPDMEYYRDLLQNGYVMVNDCHSITYPNFNRVKEHNISAFFNIPIHISGIFWGLLGFVEYEKPRLWDKSEIFLGRQIAGIFSGVISRNAAEEELIRAKEMAEQGNKSKSEFLSRMSHEMRTPLNAIIGMTEIGQTAKETVRKDYCFNKIESASTHLLGVINDILDMSRIEADKMELSNNKMNINKMFERIINMTRYQIETKRQNFSLSIGKEVPGTIISDEQRLTQVLVNLLNNAIKFTPEEGAISVTVNKLPPEPFADATAPVSGGKGNICILQFEIKDSGIGIPMSLQAKLFSSFEQADGTISRKYGGAGLGLTISKKLVQLMGGSIRVNSVTGKGTSFIFEIRAETENTIGADNPEDAATQFAEGCFKKIKILIAEDIEINREIIAELLQFTGAGIDFATNGREACEKYSANPADYNIIFMDIHMPELNGYEAVKIIRLLEDPHAKTVPIIAMTADVFQEDIEKCISAGMNDHVGKPLDMNDVLGKIAKYCM